jgi:hypothetical protein
MGLLWQTVDMFLDGDRHAQRRLTELRGMLAEQDHLAVGYVVHAMTGMLAIRAGRFDQAERLAQECLDLGVAAGDVDATGWHGAHLVAIRWYQGRLAELLPMLEQLVHSPTLSALDNAYCAVHAVAAASVGDRRTASEALARLRGGGLAELPRSSSWLVTMHGVVEAARLLGDRETAAEVYPLLEPYAHLPAMASLAVACFGSVHHALGVAALTTGDPDRAIAHLGEAITRNRTLGHWPAVEASRTAHAQALALRDQTRDQTRDQGGEPAAGDVPAPDGDRLGSVVQADWSRSVGQPATCSRERQQWRITWAGRSVLVAPRIGMLHLAVLLANAGTDILAVELAMGVAGLAEAVAARASAQPVLDPQAVRRYRDRVAGLRVRIEELGARDDHRRAAEARAERDALIAQLADNTGIGVRSRNFTGDAERARVAVGKAIRRAVSRLAEVDAVIGHHLSETVHTGVRCSYRPT